MPILKTPNVGLGSRYELIHIDISPITRPDVRVTAVFLCVEALAVVLWRVLKRVVACVALDLWITGVKKKPPL